MSMLKGNRVVGIVREVYNKWERRAPLCPQHVRRLVQAGCQVLVQPSNRRVFTDGEYAAAGATVTDDLGGASVIFGVKQVPVENLLPERTYVFFSHVIKAQPENMELLDHVLENNIRLIDYETINEGGMREAPRLVAFGGFAGRAGMIGALRGIGERMLCLGYSTPFLNVGSAYMYPSLESAKGAVRDLGAAIKDHGLPDDFAPMTFAFTGNGNVSRGAQEIFEELPHEWVAPEDLGSLPRNKNVVYGSIVEAEHMVQSIGQKPFARKEYYAHPEQFTPRFHTDFAPHVTCLVNCMYWDPQYPRLLTKQNLRDLHAASAAPGARGVNNTLLAVADITCDINGSVESLTKSTNIEQPFFLYDAELDETRDSLDGNGVLMCGVDILPSELPRESSEHFGDAMIDYVLPLASSDGTQAYKDQASDLPAELHGACITANGQLTPTFSYIGRMRRERERNAEKRHLERMEENGGSTVLRISGHLFDSGFINKTLDIIEADGGDFFIVRMDVRPNSNSDSGSGHAASARGLKSNADVQVTMPDGRAGIVGLMDKLATLATIDPTAETVIQELPFDYCHGEFSQTQGYAFTEA